MLRICRAVLLVCLVGLAGCAVIKTTDVTDTNFKRHQSVAVLGWPVYSRVTDREHDSSTHLATKIDGSNDAEPVQAAELLDHPLEPLALPSER